VLRELGAEVREVRTPADLEGLDGLVMPGGESTTMTLGIEREGLAEPLRALDIPIFGTCAGLILLADDVRDAVDVASPPALGMIDCAVVRNGYGRQRESFEAGLAVNGIEGDFPGVFIRAPVVKRVGDAVEVLATHDEHPVLVRQGAIWAATFHPELSGDLRLHQRFLTEGTAATATLPTGAAEPELATAPKEKT